MLPQHPEETRTRYCISLLLPVIGLVLSYMYLLNSYSMDKRVNDPNSLRHSLYILIECGFVTIPCSEIHCQLLSYKI